MGPRRPQRPCAAYCHRRRPWAVATTLLLVFLTSLVVLAEAQDTNTRSYCRKGCGKSPKGRCKKQSGTWTCVGECKKGFARSSATSALCDACAGGYASAISPQVPAWVASGFPSCTSTPCKRGCTQCPPGTVSPGGLIGPLGTSQGAVCLATGVPPPTTVPAGFYRDPITNQDKPCPSGYTAPFARPAGVPLSYVCLPSSSLLTTRYIGSVGRNDITYTFVASDGGPTSFNCPSGTVKVVDGVGAACATCPEGLAGDGCNSLMPGWFGSAGGGGTGRRLAQLGDAATPGTYNTPTLCPSASSSGGSTQSSTVPPGTTPTVCVTCRAGSFQQPDGTCGACPVSGTTGLPGGADENCGYCVKGFGGNPCTKCPGQFSSTAISYVTLGTPCSAAVTGCAKGVTGGGCNVPCPALSSVAVPDPFSGKVPTGIDYVEDVFGAQCTYGCPEGQGVRIFVDATGTSTASCGTCGGGEYSAGGAFINAPYTYCVRCPAGTIPVDGATRCQLGTSASAAGLFDEFD